MQWRQLVWFCDPSGPVTGQLPRAVLSGQLTLPSRVGRNGTARSAPAGGRWLEGGHFSQQLLGQPYTRPAHADLAVT